MSVSKASVPKHTQNPWQNLWNLKNIAFIKFLEFFWTKYILFYQIWPNITQDISQNAKIAINFLLDFNLNVNNAGINLTGYHPRANPWATNFFRQNPGPGDIFSVQNSGLGLKKWSTIPTPGHNLTSSNAKMLMKKEHNSRRAFSFQIFYSCPLDNFLLSWE